MKTLYLRNVPDEVVRRLQRLAEIEKVSVSAVAVRELTAVEAAAVVSDLLKGGLALATLLTGLVPEDPCLFYRDLPSGLFGKLMVNVEELIEDIVGVPNAHRESFRLDISFGVAVDAAPCDEESLVG